MPTASNIVLGINFLENAEEIMKALGLEGDPKDFFDDEKYELREKLEEALDKYDLTDAWLNAMKLRGYNPVKVKNRGHMDGYYDIKENSNEIHPFGMYLLYDEEMGYRAEDAMIVVDMTSRYFGTYIDCEMPHGGSGDPVPVLRYINAFEIAQGEISQVVPFMEKAEVVCVDQFY